jgi:hypothetical protein
MLVSMNRNSAPLLNVTNFKMGPLGEKSSVPGFPLVPLEQVPDTDCSVCSAPSLFCWLKTVGIGVALLSKTM